MKILFLSSWYPSRIHLQLGNFIQKHAEAVALQSEVASLFICSDIHLKTMYEVEQSNINNVFTVNVYYKKVNHQLPLVSHSQRAWRYLRAHFIGWRVIKQKFGTVNIIHLNVLYPAGVFSILLKKLYGYPYMITEHATEYLPINTIPFSRIRKITGRMITRGASCITVVSDNLRNAMLQHGLKGNYKVVYNVVNTDLFIPGNSRRNKFRLVHISTFNDKHKNISGMLRTIARLSQQRNDFECWFAGEGNVVPHNALAKQLGIYQSTVYFDGEKSTPEVAEFMKNADCFFMFSNYENLPVVICEAFACGLPVLSSDVGGIAEHINDSNGILVPAGDEDALLKALNTMLNNLKENKYNKNTLHEYAVKNFSYIEVSKKFHAIYSEIVSANKN